MIKKAAIKWREIEPEGKSDQHWGYTDHAALGRTLAEVKGHIGETVLISGGGGPGMSQAVLAGAEILPFGSAQGKRWGLKVHLKNVKPKIGSDSGFDPWLDSWTLWVTTESKPATKSAKYKVARSAKRVVKAEHHDPTMGFTI